jgi:hypothetical protein
MAIKANLDSTSKKAKQKKKDDKVPIHRRPEGLSMEKWQIALRKPFVESNDFISVAGMLTSSSVLNKAMGG